MNYILFFLILVSPGFKIIGQTTTFGSLAGSSGANCCYFGNFAGGSADPLIYVHNNTFLGWASGAQNTTGFGNTYLGSTAGYNNLTGSGNVAVGYLTAHDAQDSNDNVFVGLYSGRHNIGSYNVFIGAYTGSTSSQGTLNTFLGNSSGPHHTSGQKNSFLGQSSGYNVFTGENNTYLGSESGYNNTNGSNNLFLGFQAGYNEVGNNKLVINNNNSSIPLVYGEFDNKKIGINTKLVPSGYTLGVKGKIITEEVKVQLTSGGVWPDYVFNKDYQLNSLEYISDYVKEKGHLPEVPSSEDIRKNEGYELGEMDRILLKKVEELTLYLIEQNKEMIELNKEMTEQKNIIKEQNKRIQKLEDQLELFSKSK